MYKADRFRLVINDDDQLLYFDDLIVVKGCDDIVKLFLDLGLADYDDIPAILQKFDLSLEELHDLERALGKAILQDDKCMPKEQEE